MKKAHIIAIALIAFAIAAIFSTIADSGTFSDFRHAKDNPKADLHVVGKLNKNKERHYDPNENANLFSFYLIDRNGEESKVIFKGSEPQDFEKSEQVVIVGHMQGDDFLANSILMKCPSKYSNPNEEMKEFKSK